MTLDALFLALLIVSSFISIDVGYCKFTLQLLTVFLIANFLSLADGLIVIGLYIVMGLIGIPVFAGFGGGIAQHALEIDHRQVVLLKKAFEVLKKIAVPVPAGIGIEGIVLFPDHVFAADGAVAGKGQVHRLFRRGGKSRQQDQDRCQQG